jgi:hypothetical protein
LRVEIVILSAGAAAFAAESKNLLLAWIGFTAGQQQILTSG